MASKEALYELWHDYYLANGLKSDRETEYNAISKDLELLNKIKKEAKNYQNYTIFGLTVMKLLKQDSEKIVK